MPSQLTIQQGGVKALAGHAGQDGRDIIASLRTLGASKGVVVPSNETATGFRALELTAKHADGLGTNQAPLAEAIAPDAKLLGELRGQNSRTTFLPEMYSDTLSRNVRFAVSLPAGFDAARAADYPVVHVVPNGESIVAAIADGTLSTQLDAALSDRGFDKAIVVALQQRTGSGDTNNATLRDDVQAYVSAAFGAKRVRDAVLQLPNLAPFEPGQGAAPQFERGTTNASEVAHLQTPPHKGGLMGWLGSIFGGGDDENAEAMPTHDVERIHVETPPTPAAKTTPPVDARLDDEVQRMIAAMSGDYDRPSRIDAPSTSKPSSVQSFFTAKKEPQIDFARSIVLPAPEEEKKSSFGNSWSSSSSFSAPKPKPKLVPAEGWDGVVKGTTLPSANFFEPLAKRDHAGVAVMEVKSAIAGGLVDCAVVVPSHFDAKRAYPLDVVTIPKGQTVASVLKATAGELTVADRITVLVEARSFNSVEDIEKHVRLEVLGPVSDALPVDLSRIHAPRALPASKADWATTLNLTPTTNTRAAHGPVAFVDGSWQQQAPTRDHARTFPEVSKWASTQQIPKELQRQSADRGTMFISAVDSKAVGKAVQCGVYLPPGYDPDSKEKLPMLVMMPGKGMKLNQWTSVGDITPKLDAMMRGDAQKMIVLFPDNNNSFWFDYDKNGDNKLANVDGTKRDYEGLVIDELIPYVTNNFNADAKRMSIGGISRGGFGAMQLALRHPGKFHSVSAHSGVLSLEHSAGVLGDMAGIGDIKGHFGDADNAAWSRFNPHDLVNARDRKMKAPRMFVDIGAGDAYFAEDNVRFCSALKDAGIDHTFRMYANPPDAKKDTKKDAKNLEGPTEPAHNWSTWEPVLSSWIAFHQATFGKAGEVQSVPFVDVGAPLVKGYAAAQKARSAQLDKALDNLLAAVPTVKPDASKEVVHYSGHRRSVDQPLVYLAGRAGRLKKAIAEIDRKQPLHAKEALAGAAAAELDAVDAALNYANRELAGKPVVPLKFTQDEAVAFLRSAPKAMAKDIAGSLKVLPELAVPLARLLKGKPHLLTGASTFVADLNAFLRADVYDAKRDAEGMCEFVNRMATNRFDWRRGGYSNAVTAVMNSIFNHPETVLFLVRHSREGTALEFPKFYEDDDATLLRPMGDLRAGFSSVSDTKSGLGDIPGADLGYERAILRIVREELCPTARTMPSWRAFGQRTNMPVAEGLAKLRGSEVLYLYAFNLKTGADLVKAVKSQGLHGLPMADTKISIKGGPFENVHFPVFYGYDEKTRTIEMQHWEGGATRYSVDDLRFEEVAVYAALNAEIRPFLTPDKQSNAADIIRELNARD